MDPSLLIMSGITFKSGISIHAFMSYYMGEERQDFKDINANAAIARQCDIPDRMPASVSQWDKCVAVGASRS